VFSRKLLARINVNQVTKGLAKTIRAMADGTIDSQVGARICNGLGIMRACLETQKLEQLEARMDEIADRVARDPKTLHARGSAPVKPSAPCIERLLAKVEAKNSRAGHVRADTAFMRTRKRGALATLMLADRPKRGGSTRLSFVPSSLLVGWLCFKPTQSME